MAAVVYVIKDHIMVVTLDRPQVRNAWNAELAQGLHDAWQRLVADDSIRVCVVTANGGFFSAGMDLKDPPYDLATRAMPNLSVPCDKPILLAAEGGAIG